MSDTTKAPQHPAPEHEESAGAALAIAQFVVTGVLLGVVATLAYFAGMRSAGKEGGGEAARAAAGPGATVNVAALLKPTPELIAKGKTLFAVNCASCHGVAGFGDGPAAAALNPKPRNYHEGYWRYGGGVARIVQTISAGSPGTAMAAFTNIPLEDRFALAHFVRTFAPKLEEDKPADLAWLGPIGGEGGARATPGAGPGGPAKPGPTIPIELALRLMTEPAPPGMTADGSMASGSAAPPSDAPGAKSYAQRCASCHGASGEGGVRVRMLGSAPYAYMTTLPVSGWHGADPARFEKLILEGLPGWEMPGNGDLSREEIRGLYDFTTQVLPKSTTSAPAGATRS